MVKKHRKKKSIAPTTQTTTNTAIKVNNTIMLTIMIVIVFTVSLVEVVMFVNSRESIKSIQNNLPSDFIQSLNVFNNNEQSIQQFEQELPFLQSKINQIIYKNYKVKDVIVTDDKLNEVYKTLEPTDKYIYNIAGEASTFRLMATSRYNASNYRSVLITKLVNDAQTKEKKTYYIHLIIPAGDNTQMQALTDFAKIFFAVILMISIFVAFKLARSISKPLSDMEEIVSKIASGDLSGRLDYTRYNEINKLVQSYNMMANALQRLYSTLEMQVQDRTKELKAAYAELQSTQAMMVHSEKMKSLGELVAGIMHENNNPINFIYGNMTHLSNYSNDLIQIIEEYSASTSINEEERKKIEDLKQEIDYEFLKTDLPDLIKSCKEGADRAKNIIQDLKSFSRMEEATITDVDIPHEIDTTLNILHNKIKNKAEIHKEYMENVPKIEAFGGQLNQVFMNILDNAVGAITETGDIWIRINPADDNKNIIIEIEDSGAGMDEETTRKVFNPFFTTKPVGQGTGLGLSITYKIIKNHQGDIRCESELGKGTKFIITLPINIDRENLNAGIGVGGENGQV